MSPSMIYALLAVLALLLAQIVPFLLLQAVLFWTALSLALVAWAYKKNLGKVFGKTTDGKLPLVLRILFIPFLLGVHAYNYCVRARASSPSIQEIEPGLYLGARLTPSDMTLVRQYEIDAVLDVTAEFDALSTSAIGEDVVYLNIPVLDHAYPSFERIQESVNWVAQQRKAGRNVVIHCALGRGRSFMVLCAYLLAKDNNASIDSVISRVQAIRPRARLNHKQKRVLQDYFQLGLTLDEDLQSVKPKLAIIANPVSGGGKWTNNKEKVLELLSPYFVIDVKETTPEISATQLAKQAVSQDVQVMIAAGGDGTVNEVAGQLIDTDIPLGLIPCGTANALSYALLGVKSKLLPVQSACDVVLNGHTKTIDTAWCNRELVLLVMALGFEQKMIEYADRDEKNSSGQGAYLQGFFNAVSDNECMSLMATIDGERQSLETTSLVVANAAPIFTLLAQGNGEPDFIDGLLDLTWLKPSEHVGEHLLSLSELLGSSFQENREKVQHQQVKRVYLEGEDTLHYAVDGELKEAKSIEIKVNPSSLKLFMPLEE